MRSSETERSLVTSFMRVSMVTPTTTCSRSSASVVPNSPRAFLKASSSGNCDLISAILASISSLVGLMPFFWASARRKVCSTS
ncbi:hypothetical protein D3C78_1467730 [compost metagenome]